MSSDMNINLNNITVTINGKTRLITGNELHTIGIDNVDGVDANGNAYECLYTRNDSVDAIRYAINNAIIGTGGLHRDIFDNPSTLEYVTNDMNTTRNYTRAVERDKIIEILKREKNVNTKKCMYVEDLVKEIAKIMEVHL